MGEGSSHKLYYTCKPENSTCMCNAYTIIHAYICESGRPIAHKDGAPTEIRPDQYPLNDGGGTALARDKACNCCQMVDTQNKLH